MFTRREASIEPIDLNEAAREVIALSLSDLQRNGVIVRTGLADDLPQVDGDRIQLQQVILNLILNASDAMSGVIDRPRTLVIRTERSADAEVKLSVEDSGVGFNPEIKNRLFEAFYTTKSNGMGIGLAISRSIIESHHGRLLAIPKDNGPGAMFSFSIPAGGRRPVA
jgi:signal transduction histidine kinase